MTSFEGLCEILAKDYQLTPEQMMPETRLADLEIDSLGVIELIFAIEETFKVTAADADSDSARNFATLQDVSNYIDRLIAQRDAPATPATAPTPIAAGTSNDGESAESAGQ
ncbi:MAG: phosphopantetheine-binding protein [Arenimonas sp.]